jgi:hypothetical protein
VPSAHVVVVVEGIMVYQMASRSIGKAWQRGKGKPRDALYGKLACCLYGTCVLAVPNRCLKIVLSHKGLMTKLALQLYVLSEEAIGRDRARFCRPGLSLQGSPHLSA